MGNWVVYNGCPTEDEDQSRKHSTSLSGSSEKNGGNKSSEHLTVSGFLVEHQVIYHLICSEYNGGNSVVGFSDRLVQDSPESNMGSISQKDTTSGRKDETVSDKEPLERNDSERDDREEKE